MFSLYQTAKILKHAKMKSSENIYKSFGHPKTFYQNTAVFEYHYLKSKLLFNYDILIDFNNSLFQKKKRGSLLQMKFLRDYYPRNGNQYIRLVKELLLSLDREWNKALNIIMKNNFKDGNINLRMTILEIH
jgi:hypothetical protein